jgi:acetyl esterase/lipase
MRSLFSSYALLAIALVPSTAFAHELANPPPTHANVAYGPHARTVLDFWQAEGEGARPLFVMIHGGGWTAGDKDQHPSQAIKYLPNMPSAAYVMPYLERGISCAAINYRFTPDNPLPAPVLDAARAIQFLRSKSGDWNIRKDRVALTGVSAGAATSMWLLLHDDLAEPGADDPVLCESTRVSAAVGFLGQTSIDPKVLEEWLGPQGITHRMPYMAVGEKSIEDALRNYESHREMFVEFSPITHVSSDDPPLMMVYDADVSLPAKNASHAIHHPFMGIKLREKADAVGMECHLVIAGQSDSKGISDPFEFVVSKLLAP